MDKCSFEPLEVVPLLKKAQMEDTPRPPLGPSEKHNAVPVSRRPPTREVASRYKFGITTRANSNTIAPRRCPSPDVSRNCPAPGASLPKRAQSAERKRPSTTSSRSSNPNPTSRPSMRFSPATKFTTPVHDSTVEMHNSSAQFLAARAPDGLWPSIRNLSSSFQAETISTSASKKDRIVVSASPDQSLKSSANAVTAKKKTPLRGRNSSDHMENSIPVEKSHLRLVDHKMWPGMMGGKMASNSLSRSRDLADKVYQSASLLIPSRGVSPRRMPISGGLQQVRNEVVRKMSPDANGKGERDTSLAFNASSHPLGRALSGIHPVGTQSSHPPVLHCPPSPCRTLSASSPTSKVMQNPPRARPSTPFSSSSSKTSRPSVVPSVLNYIVDVRKGKKTANHIDDVHQLRLLYNRDLQWHFVNAQAVDALFIQKMRTENILYNVWKATVDLHESVILKRISLQHLRQEMKLDVTVKEQVSYLEEWAALETEHCKSLSGAIEALKASTLRLPVTGGARADAYAMKNAISSAVDVMQVMGSSICSLLSKIEGTKVLVSELSAVAANERAMLDACRELLASTATMQVQESSLRTQLIQLKQRDRKTAVTNHDVVTQLIQLKQIDHKVP